MKINTRLLKELMVTNGWKIEDLANLSGLSRSTISRALCGKDLFPSSITKLYNVMEVDVKDLIDWGEWNE